MAEHSKQLLSIWFFIGALLLIYGILIVGAEAFATPAQPVVMGDLRFGFWMGSFLILLGGYYTWHFRPGKN